MADLVRIGTVAERTATTRYNLLDKTTAGNIYLVDNGILQERTSRDGDLVIMKFRVKSHTGTNAQIQAAEEKIQDHLIDAEKYATNQHRTEPVFLWFNADGITERKRCIVKGELVPVQYSGTNELLIHDVAFYDLFLWCYPPWEGVTETTELSTVTFDYNNDNTTSMTNLLGDVPGRISELTIRAIDAHESSPLYKCWIGIRPEYISMDDYNPIWNLGYSTAQAADVSLASTNSQCYPALSTQNNYMSCDFDSFTSDVTRTSISMEDVWKNEASELLTNPGAESGNTTGWTVFDAGWAATTNDANTGTYSFESVLDGAGLDYLYQDTTAVAGNTYNYDLYAQYDPTTGGYLYVNFAAMYSCGDTLQSGMGGLYIADNSSIADGNYHQRTGYIVAPTNTGYFRTILYHAAGGTTGTARVDDVSFKQVYADDYDGDYLVLLRCRVDTGEVDVYGRYGYAGTATRPKFGRTQSVTHTNWQLVPLGVVSIPPERRITDEESFWRINKLTFDINAEEISGTPTLDMDSLILIPWEHGFYAEDVSICKSTDQTVSGVYLYADLHVYKTALDEFVIIAEDESFEGVDTNVKWSSHNWTIPAEDCIIVAFAERSTFHYISDQFTVSLNYYPRYIRRYSD